MICWASLFFMQRHFSSRSDPLLLVLSLTGDLLWFTDCVCCLQTSKSLSQASWCASHSMRMVLCAEKAFPSVGALIFLMSCKLISMLSGQQGHLRLHMLDLMGHMGLDVQKAMPPSTITHVVASDLQDRTSKKLEHARRVQ